MAKDCTGDAAKQQSNYVLKEDNKQRGGDGNSRFVGISDPHLIPPVYLSLKL